MTTKESPHEAGQSESTRIVDAGSPIAKIEVWGRTSRLAGVGLVLDLEAPDTTLVLRSVRSREARRSLHLVRAAGSRFAVCCGQLLRKKAGALVMGLQDPAGLPAATIAGFHRLTEVGETHSLWICTLAEPLRSQIMGGLAALSAVEGCA